MKRLVYVLLAALMTLGLSACAGVNQKTDEEVKIIPRNKEQTLDVVGIDRLHPGRAWDITPDGKTLLFSWDEGVPEDPNSEMRPPGRLYTMNLEDQSTTPISSSKMNQGQALYSPDGKSISFMENEEESFTPFVMKNTVGGTKMPLGDSMEHSMVRPPMAWSPDSKYLAVAEIAGGRAGVNGRIVLYDREDGSGLVVTGRANAKMASHPYFYDDETLLYISSDHTGQEQPALVALDLNNAKSGLTKEIVLLTGGSRFALSPNKQRLAYVEGYDDGRFVIKVIALDSDLQPGATLAEVNVTDGPPALAWSPDGRYLVYSDRDLWALNPETKQKKQLTSGMMFILNFFWSSDREVIFSGVPVDEGGNQDLQIYRIKLTFTEANES